MHDIGCWRVLDRVFWFVGVRSCFSLNVPNEFGVGFWATLVSNNREGTEEMTKAVAKGCGGVVNGLGHGIAACLSGVV